MKLKYQKKFIILVLNAVFLVLSSTYQQLQGMEKKDYYQILGVPRGASLEEIKKAYRTLVFEYHPDQVQRRLISELTAQLEKEEITKEQYERRLNQRLQESTALFTEIQSAYETLSDYYKRQAYDISKGFTVISEPKKFTVEKIMKLIEPLFTDFKRKPTVETLNALLSLLGEDVRISVRKGSYQDIYPFWKLVRAIGVIGYRSNFLRLPTIFHFDPKTTSIMNNLWSEEIKRLNGMLNAIDRETTAVGKEKALMKAVNELEDLALMAPSVQEELAEKYYTVAREYLQVKNFAKAREVAEKGIRQIETVWEYYPIDERFKQQLQELIQEINKRRDEEEKAQLVELQSSLVTLNSNLMQLAILVK